MITRRDLTPEQQTLIDLREILKTKVSVRLERDANMYDVGVLQANRDILWWLDQR